MFILFFFFLFFSSLSKLRNLLASLDLMCSLSLNSSFSFHLLGLFFSFFFFVSRVPIPPFFVDMWPPGPRALVSGHGTVATSVPNAASEWPHSSLFFPLGSHDFFFLQPRPVIVEFLKIGFCYLFFWFIFVSFFFFLWWRWWRVRAFFFPSLFRYALTTLQGRPNARAQAAGMVAQRLETWRFELWEAQSEPLVAVFDSWTNQVSPIAMRAPTSQTPDC